MTQGSISTTLMGKGRAELNFGNCFSSGEVFVHLNGILIASVSANTPKKTVKFDFDLDSVLKISEEGGIIQFNELKVIECKDGSQGV